METQASNIGIGIGAGVIITPRLCILCTQEQARRSEEGLITIVSARYYLHETGDTWAVGPFYAWENSVLGGDEFLGIGAEYVVGRASGWQWGIGLGVAAQSGHSGVDVLPSLAVGYAF